MNQTLEQDFSQAKTNHESSIDREATHWAIWIVEANQQFGAFSDLLWGEEFEQDRWNEPQQKMLKELITTDNLTFKKVYDLLTNIGNTDDIWNLCFDHICYMLAFTQFSEEEVDNVIEMTQKCDDCLTGLQLHAYQWVVTESPLELDEVMELIHSKHTNLTWSYVGQIESEVLRRGLNELT